MSRFLITQEIGPIISTWYLMKLKIGTTRNQTISMKMPREYKKIFAGYRFSVILISGLCK